MENIVFAAEGLLCHANLMLPLLCFKSSKLTNIKENNSLCKFSMSLLLGLG